MPGCVLRISSTTTKVEVLVRASGLTPIVIFRKGHPKVHGASALSKRSGFNVDVSGDGYAIEKQARDAIRFLKRHEAGLRRMRRCKSFGGMTLDFGLYDRPTQASPWPSYRLPAALIESAGRLAIGIDLSFYGSSGR
jgi:hypothetical protein